MSGTKFELRALASGWRGICLVAVTYVYFLIFAQFAFIKRLAELGIADTHLKIVMGAMAAGGILLSLIAGRPLFAASAPSPRMRLQAALCICSAAAIASLLPLSLGASLIVSFAIGAGLGLLTVTLVSHLPLWLGHGDGLIKVGVGTGLGYLICNLPPLFTAAPESQAITAASLSLAGIIAAAKLTSPSRTQPPTQPQERISFGRVLVCFTALVWLDSAAFFIIQNTPILKAGTWEGTAHLWVNGLIHLVAAIAGAWLLRRRGLPSVFNGAVLLLAAACLLLLNPDRTLLASVLYPIGVSLYSVALVAYPSLLSSATSSQERARKAGIIYSVAGWFGSAMGIGMGQHLGEVPVVFVALAATLVLGPQMLVLIRRRTREMAAVTAALTAALCIRMAIIVLEGSAGLAQHDVSPIERGRQVYISEGCINCHSQYVRPNKGDVMMWGPAETVEELHSQRPPLIGNRRQGPDLTQVGGRRSPLWLKAHLYDPQQLSPSSFMPSYAYLFRGGTRGDDLIAYFSTLKSPAYTEHVRAEQAAWQPFAINASAVATDRGAHLFNAYCATCHEPNGATRQAWSTSFRLLPTNLQTGPWLYLQTSNIKNKRELTLARIIKFGIPGTDMPGHEYLSDRDVSSIALWLDRSMVQPGQFAIKHNTTGGNK